MRILFLTINLLIFCCSIYCQNEDAQGEKYVSLYALGKHKRLLKESNKAIENNLDTNVAYFVRGLANLELKNYKSAIDDLSEAINRNLKKSSRAYYARGLAKSKLQDLKGAILDFSEAIKGDSTYYEAYRDRCRTWVDLKEHKMILNDCNKALELNSKSNIALLNRGVAKYNLGDYDGAMNDYNQVISLNPNIAFSYYNRGLLKEKMDS